MTTRDEAFAKLGQGHQLDDECKRIIAEEWGFKKVVLCKDCKNREECETMCKLDDDWFCADGKRKEGEK